MSASPVVYVDARCFQDPICQFRSVGHHTASLLRTRRTNRAADCTVVGLIDTRKEEVPTCFRKLFDYLTPSLNPSFLPSGSIFINPSPMTNSPAFNLRFAGHPNLLTAAVVYDFIPLDRDGYLPTVSARMDYVARLAHLRNVEIFLPISHYAAKRLTELLGVDEADIVVTGASIRSSLFEAAERAGTLHPPGRRRPYFLSVGSNDRRKNTETVIRALHRVRAREGHSFGLKLVGHCDGDYQAELREIAAEHGDASFLEQFRNIDDQTLAELYAGAIATVAPSHIEGFSLPVAEAAVCRSPVIASTCAAHLELIDQPEALFDSDDPDGLAEKLLALIRDGELRERLVTTQHHLAQEFHEDTVGARTWGFLMDRFERLAGPRGVSFVKRSRKPKIAFLSPFPPDESGVARFTQLTLEAGASAFDADLYTDAPRPLGNCGGFRDAGPVSIKAIAGPSYDSIVSVIGNSHFHTRIFEVFERYGGPCILHDSRLTGVYFGRLGGEGFLLLASRLLKRTVTMEDVWRWLRDEQLETLFVEPILERARPLIVHTKQYQQYLFQRYGFEAELTTFPPNMQFDDDLLAEPSRLQARQRIGIQPGVFVVSTFGHVARNKGALDCISAMEFVRSWNVPAELFFVGGIDPELKTELQRLAQACGVESHIHFHGGFVELSRYRDFLVASDAAIQLRTYGFGQPSAALADCISAGLPSVATRELAESCDSPSYVLRIPDAISALHLAQRLTEIWEMRQRPPHIYEERQLYCKVHSFEYYVRRLLEILG
jgi:glycosyltransferase involved in cell wall biosynthesis